MNGNYTTPPAIGKQLEIGAGAYTRAAGFIFSNGLWWAFLIPLFLNILLFMGGFALVDSATTEVKDLILGWLKLEEKVSSGSFLFGLVEGFIGVVMNIFFFFLFTAYGGYVVLILLSPLFAYLSERTEEIISGKKFPFDAVQFMRDIIRGVLIALRNLFIETGWIILFFVLGFIPVIGWAGAFVLLIISAYFYGFSFLDYTNERRRRKIGESIQFIRRYKWVAVANGLVFCLFLAIPFCGVLLAGFAAIVSVVAATLAMNELDPVKGAGS